MIARVLLAVVLSAVVLAPWTYQPICDYRRPYMDSRLRTEFQLEYVRVLHIFYDDGPLQWSGFALGAFGRIFVLPWDNLGDMPTNFSDGPALTIATDWMEEGLDRGPVYEWMQARADPDVSYFDRLDLYCAALRVVASPDYARTGELLER